MTAFDSRTLRSLAMAVAVLAAAPAARADDTPPSDTPPADTGTPPADTGTTPPADTGTTPPADTGTTPPADTGTTPPADTGTTPPADTGTTPPADTGTTPPADTGTTPPTGNGTQPEAKPETPEQPAPTPAPAPAARSYGVDPLTGVPLGSSGKREAAHVLIQRKDRAEGKFDLSIAMPVLVNGKFTNQLGIGGDFMYHFRETFGLGIGGTYFALAQNSGFTDDELIQKAGQAPIVADALIMNWEAHVYAEVAPIYGKFALFNYGVAQFGFYFGAGAGLTSTKTELFYDPTSGNRTFGDTGIMPMGYLSGGFRFFFTEHIALRLEIRDYIYAASVSHINGCTANDLLQLKSDTSATPKVSGGCDYSAFGPQPSGGANANMARTQNAGIAWSLINTGSSDEVLNNIMATLAFSVLF